MVSTPVGRVRGALAVAVVAAVIVGGVVGWRWWSSPGAFAATGVAGEVGARPLEGAAFTLAVGQPSRQYDGEVVHVDRVEVVLAGGSVPVTTEVGLCVPLPGADPFYVLDDVSASCEEVRPLEVGQRLVLAPGATEPYLVVEVRPAEPGRVAVTGVDVTYRRGADHLWQRGTQRLDVDLVATAR